MARRSAFRLLGFLLLLLLSFFVYSRLSRGRGNNNPDDVLQHGSKHIQEGQQRTLHAIDELIEEAAKQHEKLISQHPDTLSDAAAEYRRQRDRHPPPRFDEWLHFAHSRGALVAESFFDQIYDDLRPFWGLPPEEIREAAAVYPWTISVRNGSAIARTAQQPVPSSLNAWHDMLTNIAEWLPDVDIPINIDDMPHIITPYEAIAEFLKYESYTREGGLLPKEYVVQNFAPIPALPADDLPPLEPVPWEQQDVPFWENAREACPPTSKARKAHLARRWSIQELFPSSQLPGSYKGYVSNWTLAKSACEHPHLRNLHGCLIAPTQDNVATFLTPLFSGSKIQGINNDILLPSSFYWQQMPEYSGENSRTPWAEKKDVILWRGQASGGFHHKDNWRGFHRQRFVAMLNSTLIQLQILSTRINRAVPSLFPPVSKKYYHDLLPDYSKNGQMLGKWLKPFSDVAFTHFLCNPWFLSQFGPADACDYLNSWFEIKERMAPVEQFKAKYLPDIDGHAWSARYLGFLKSESVPIKATLFAEWHDSRLVAWQHFVPMDNTFMDFWGIMSYFLGNGEELDADGKRVGSHDCEAEMIGHQGHVWAERVLRKDDMLVYVYRLMLEYARLCDENRLVLGYVGDL